MDLDFNLTNLKPFTYLKTLHEWEREIILRTLMSVWWNRTEAAKVLGISIKTMRNKLSIYRFEGFVIPKNPDATRQLPCRMPPVLDTKKISCL